VHTRLLPAVQQLRDAMHAKQEEYAAIVKIGRTHMMDAVPLTLGALAAMFVSASRSLCLIKLSVGTHWAATPSHLSAYRCPPFAGQEFSGYVTQLDMALARVRTALPELADLAIGVRLCCAVHGPASLYPHATITTQTQRHRDTETHM
jgi:fumarate hydratase, class II